MEQETVLLGSDPGAAALCYGEGWRETGKGRGV